jgi:hypothetical protein
MGIEERLARAHEIHNGSGNGHAMQASHSTPIEAGEPFDKRLLLDQALDAEGRGKRGASARLIHDNATLA